MMGKRTSWMVLALVLVAVLAALAGRAAAESVRDYTRPAKPEGLAPYGDDTSAQANAVSGNGLVPVGISMHDIYDVDNDLWITSYRPVRWVNGVAQDLGIDATEPKNTWAVGANYDGSVVVGSGSTNTGGAAFRWTSSGIDYVNANAFYGVSGDGNVAVGDGMGDVAVRWTQSGGLVGLGTLALGTQETYSRADGTNSDGSAVVGMAYGVTYGEGDPVHVNRAFLWTQSLGMVDLNEYLPSLGIDMNGWTLNDATGILADGCTIVGWGTHNGESNQSFAVTVPEPSTFALLGMGAIGLLGYVWRKRK